MERFPAVCLHPDGTYRTDGPRPAVVLPGSFNPLHHGHTTLAAVAAARLGQPVGFELSAANVDKPGLSAAELGRRLAQFTGLGPVWVTRAATFEAKATLFPGVAFVVGYDTAARLVDPRYYAGDPVRRDVVLRALLAAGSRVVVGGRLDASGTFRTWSANHLATEIQGLFLPLDESDFRVDVSSTALRQRAGTA